MTKISKEELKRLEKLFTWLQRKGWGHLIQGLSLEMTKISKEELMFREKRLKSILDGVLNKFQSKSPWYLELALKRKAGGYSYWRAEGYKERDAFSPFHDGELVVICWGNFKELAVRAVRDAERTDTYTPTNLNLASLKNRSTWWCGGAAYEWKDFRNFLRVKILEGYEVFDAGGVEVGSRATVLIPHPNVSSPQNPVVVTAAAAGPRGRWLLQEDKRSLEKALQIAQLRIKVSEIRLQALSGPLSSSVATLLKQLEDKFDG